jgi:DNA-directed RNA polymerase specialized sigma24 family protein
MDYSKLTPQELIRELARSGRPEAWAEFLRRYERMIFSVARNRARRYGENSPAVHEELGQEFYLKVWAKDRQFLRAMDTSPDSNIEGFLKVAMAHLVDDYFKGRNAKKRGAGVRPENVDDVQPASSSHTAGGAADTEWQILKRELEAYLAQRGFSQKEIDIYDLYEFQDWTAKQIAALPWAGLSEKGVESLVRRIRLALRDFLGKDEGPKDGKS